ncbi:restriction endonuclease subunit S [Exiguobacterium aurantiacum]|uniref:restriction endonuclease subunit S n=1 Tax=Exiguobacterium aurantiacum TaxID=33987 RepID=UPI00384F814F
MKKITPFLHFHNTVTEWSQQKLGDVVAIFSGWTPSEFKITDDKSGYMFIKVDDLNKTDREQDTSKIHVEEHQRFKKIKKNSVIFPKRGAAIMTNKIRILKTESYMDTNMMGLEAKKIDADFLYSLLQKEKLYKIADTSTLPQINNKHIEPYIIYLPGFNEQKQIGKFFRDLDETISLHQQELEALKQTKQGFLQKMFPKKGQLIPEIRLSGYKENWKEMKFKNLAEIRRGLTYKPKDVDKTGVRVLRSSNIKGDSFILKNDDVFVKQEAVNIDYAKENEILITSANGSSNLVGKHALIKKLDQPTVHGGFMLIASAKTPYFVNTLMSTEWYDRFIKVHVSGGNGAIGNLNKNNLENYSVMVPSIEEQIKIGDFFRQLDEVIELKEKEVEALKETKKGFLQKMFI